LPKLKADDRPFETMVNGRVFRGHTRDVLQLYVYVFRVWEPNLTAFIEARLSEGDVFVDVGANVGWFSLLAAQLVGPQGRVVAIEPSPLIARELKRNLEANHFDNIRIVNAAAYSRRGGVRIVHGPQESLVTTRVVQGGDTPCDTLQELVGAEDLSKVRIVKIDVEGAECDVIEGFTPALSDIPPNAEVVVEIAPERVEDPRRLKMLFASFDKAGYSPYILPNNYAPESYLLDEIPKSFERLRVLPTVQTDVIFSRHDSDTLPLG